MLVADTRAFFHYKEAKALEKEKSKCSILSTPSSILLRNTTFIGLLILNRTLPTPRGQSLSICGYAWNRFITKYREANRHASSNEATNAEYILVGIDEQQGQMLQTLRNQLDMRIKTVVFFIDFRRAKFFSSFRCTLLVSHINFPITTAARVSFLRIRSSILHWKRVFISS